MIVGAFLKFNLIEDVRAYSKHPIMKRRYLEHSNRKYLLCTPRIVILFVQKYKIT